MFISLICLYTYFVFYLKIFLACRQSYKHLNRMDMCLLFYNLEIKGKQLISTFRLDR